jgi:hypothetical protein
MPLALTNARLDLLLKGKAMTHPLSVPFVGRRHFVITPGDTSASNFPTDATVFVGVGGDVALVNAPDGVAVYKNVPSGTTLPASGIRVNATGTTATNMIGVYSP